MIYQHDVSLSEEQAKDLAAFAEGASGFLKFVESTKDVPAYLEKTLEWLKANEIAAETAEKGLELTEKAEPIIGAVELFAVGSELWERESMIAMFLKLNSLSAIGLGDPPSESSAPAAPSFDFSKALVSHWSVAPSLLKSVASGMLWDVALEMRAAELGDLTYKDLAKFGFSLKVYEVSHCSGGGTDCEPGYRNNPGTGDVLRTGIEAALAIHLILTYAGGIKIDDYAFEIPYDAIAWTQTQHGLRGVTSG